MTVRIGQGQQDGGGRALPGSSAVPLSAAYDTALLDLDGVVYAGGEAIPYAVEALGVARTGGMHLAYVTNNALRTPEEVATHLTELGVAGGGRGRGHLGAGGRAADRRRSAAGIAGVGHRG